MEAISHRPSTPHLNPYDNVTMVWAHGGRYPWYTRPSVIWIHMIMLPWLMGTWRALPMIYPSICHLNPYDNVTMVSIMLPWLMVTWRVLPMIDPSICHLNPYDNVTMVNGYMDGVIHNIPYSVWLGRLTHLLREAQSHWPPFCFHSQLCKNDTKNSDAMKLSQIFKVPTKTRPFSAGVSFWSY